MAKMIEIDVSNKNNIVWLSLIALLTQNDPFQLLRITSIKSSVMSCAWMDGGMSKRTIDQSQRFYNWKFFFVAVYKVDNYFFGNQFNFLLVLRIKLFLNMLTSFELENSFHRASFITVCVCEIWLS